MSSYAHFSDYSCNLKTDDNEHKDDHDVHFENAKKFVHISDQKRFAKNAVEVVKAQQYMNVKIQNNVDYLQSKVVEKADVLCGKIDYFRECVFDAMFFYKCICSNEEVKQNYKECFHYIVQSFVTSEPKKRYTALMAINQRFVLFDDASPNGMKNLDELRDHLDGRIKVPLEKKNMQPILQWFPPGIITSNNELINNLKVRVKEFKLKPFRLGKHEFDMNEDVLFIILTLWNLIPTESYLWRYITEYQYDWHNTHVTECKLCKAFVTK